MNKNGFALVSVVLAFVIISLMALFVTNFISIESDLSSDKYRSTKSYYSTQAGFENAKRRLSKIYKWNTLKEGLLEYRGDNLGGASFETYIYLPFTALKNNINKNTSSLTVFDTSRFPSSNILLLIGDEQILCTNKTPTTFANCQRGQNGTTRQVHFAGDTVYPVAVITSVNSLAGTITVDNNEKFLTSGVLLIDSDPAFNNPFQVNYTDKKNNIFWGCDNLSWYTPGTYYVINAGLDITEQIEITSNGLYDGVSKKLNITISR